MTTIQELRARQILDSRGTPTVEVDCILSDGSFGRAAVPSGASTGSHEALELRDGDKALYGGKSVLRAVEHVQTTIQDAVRGQDVGDQRKLDALLCTLDGTPNKSRLGANAILGVSMAVCRARAAMEDQMLWQSLGAQYAVLQGNDILMPVPMMNVINGGKHADSGLSFQECMLIPAGFDSFADALRAGDETFQTLKGILTKLGHVTAVGDEGGFAPHVKTAREAFDLLLQAIEKAGYAGKIRLGIDAAASEFCADSTYTVDGQTLDSAGLTAYYQGLLRDYPLVSIEDSHAEDDWEGFAALRAAAPETQLVGDDLFVTNTQRIATGYQKKAANAVLIKLNQIGTVTETVDAILLAQKQGWNAIVSHRSGVTEDTFIAHLAVGLRTGQIKTGSLSRTDRICKYNELLRIQEAAGSDAIYGRPFAA
jgi:enolase